jgi:hypothetical protein
MAIRSTIQLLLGFCFCTHAQIAMERVLVKEPMAAAFSITHGKQHTVLVALRIPSYTRVWNIDAIRRPSSIGHELQLLISHSVSQEKMQHILNDLASMNVTDLVLWFAHPFAGETKFEVVKDQMPRCIYLNEVQTRWPDTMDMLDPPVVDPVGAVIAKLLTMGPNGETSIVSSIVKMFK